MAFETVHLRDAHKVPAPDGSTVHLLPGLEEAGTAVFELPPGAVARAVRHPRVQEIWFVVAGQGEIWRRSEYGQEGTDVLEPGLVVTLPRRTAFQFRCTGDEPLMVLGVTMPPWGGDADAEFVADYWAPTV